MIHDSGFSGHVGTTYNNNPPVYSEVMDLVTLFGNTAACSSEPDWAIASYGYVSDLNLRGDEYMDAAIYTLNHPEFGYPYTSVILGPSLDVNGLPQQIPYYGVWLFRPAMVVPEPSTFVLFGIGAISLLAYAWRRRRV